MLLELTYSLRGEHDMGVGDQHSRLLQGSLAILELLEGYLLLGKEF